MPWPARAEGSSADPGAVYDAGSGARALAMGGAHTAVVQDVHALYYNPGGLAMLPGRQVTFLHAAGFAGSAYDYIGFAQNAKKFPGGWGAEVLRLGASGGDGRDANNQKTGDFGYSETGFGAGAGVRGLLHPLMSVGFRFKTLSRSLGGSSDRMMGFDAGTQFGPFLNERLIFGAVFQNVLGIATGDTADRLPLRIRAGAGWKVMDSLTLAMDVSDSRELRLGTEYGFGIMSLRAGLEPAGLTVGTGFLFRRAYAVDFALVNHPVLGMSQKLSLGYRFAAPKGKPKVQEAFAQEYIADYTLELEKRDYAKALHDLESAVGVDSRLNEQGWRTRLQRLRAVVTELRLADRPELQSAFQVQSVQTALAHQAVLSFLDRDEGRAMLFAHAAHGQNTREGTFNELLTVLGSLTHREVRREDILPVETLISRKLQDAVTAVGARKYDQAVRSCQDALLLDPNNAMAWTRLGSAHFAGGNRAQAVEAWSSALRLNPEDKKLRDFMKEQKLDLP